jgi:hypothetical protein
VPLPAAGPAVTLPVPPEQAVVRLTGPGTPLGERGITHGPGQDRIRPSRSAGVVFTASKALILEGPVDHVDLTLTGFRHDDHSLFR